MTQSVFNHPMTTVGERIKRARIARKMSGDDLATAVGYSGQSAISNLENRAGGTGGKKLPDIARALGVPVTWLLEGPDDGQIPFIEKTGGAPAVQEGGLQERAPAARYSNDASVQEAMDLFIKLRTEQRLKAIAYMRELLTGESEAGTHQIGDGESDPVPQTKAA